MSGLSFTLEDFAYEALDVPELKVQAKALLDAIADFQNALEEAEVEVG